MPPSKIMIIRHAEKPSKDGTVWGVNEDGTNDNESLTVRGWQRAGALVRLFGPTKTALSDQRLAGPQHLFASRVDLAAGSKSKRSKQTLTPIAQALGVSIDDSCAKGEEVGLANAIMPKTGIVLVAWERQKIPAIVQAIVGDTTSAPQAWPHDRFDVVWILDWQDSGWKFDEAPQLLLAGDSPNGIS